MADKPDSNSLSEVLAKMNEHDEALKALKSMPEMISKLSEAVGIAGSSGEDKEIKKSTWSLGLSDEETEDDICNKMINGDSEKEQDREDPEIEGLLQDIEKETDFDEDLLPQVAEGFGKTVLRPLTKESKEKLKISLKIPNNCKQFNQQLQHTLSASLAALSKIANIVVSQKREIPKETTNSIVKLAMDAGNIIGDQIQVINSNRRQDVKKHLNPEYMGICNAQISQSEWLFGSDLNESLKASKATASLIRQTASRPPNRYQPYIMRPRSNVGSLNWNRPFRPNYQRGSGQFRQSAVHRPFLQQNQQYNQQKNRKF
ncbi:hypothetical protein Fcan01_18847 [Folsomia candida]|uniref:Uncharacterized protein n=1 Tax=Folsomia candida TaxID=158441 RepID=A0A226DMV7_FOLCA|nr:hypothetical protein Fcan01_18847 [Folsomia candida]